MVVFRAAQAYISPSWFPSKHELHRQVPTWNYEVVHAHGTITVRDDERFVRGIVARLTRRHEAAEPRPWKMGDSAPDFIDDMLGRIVGIEIALTSLVGKSKLSQNKETRIARAPPRRWPRAATPRSPSACGRPADQPAARASSTKARR